MPVDTENLIYVDASGDSQVTITTNNVGWWDTTAYIDCNLPHKSQHFNCKRCGAPNQVDVCEYCGCAAEE